MFWLGVGGALAVATYLLWPGIVEVFQSYGSTPSGTIGGLTAQPIKRKPAEPLDPAFDQWLAKLDEAMKQAGREHKDLLIEVAGADVGPQGESWQKLTASSAFRREARKYFVLAQPPSGWFPPRGARFHKPSRHEYYSFLLADAEGKVYAAARNLNLDPKHAADALSKLRDQRGTRDQLLAAAADGAGPDRLDAAKTALDFFEEHQLTVYYPSQLQAWAKAAALADPKTTAGSTSFFSKPTGSAISGAVKSKAMTTFSKPSTTGRLSTSSRTPIAAPGSTCWPAPWLRETRLPTPPTSTTVQASLANPPILTSSGHWPWHRFPGCSRRLPPHQRARR
jgi:hypothetical protein